MNDSAPVKSAAPLLLVTGVSGAGKSSALKVLEDLGYEAVDNLPVSMIGRLIADGDFPHPIAIGIDIRTRNFDADGFLRELDQLSQRPGMDVTLLFLDCDDEILGRRFKETRRRHPLADDRPVSDGLAQERAQMAGVREQAGVLVDTSDMALKDLKRTLEGHFSLGDQSGLAIFVTSFSFRRGLPRDADLVFDVRFLRNPHYDADLRPLSGRDAAVGAYITEDEGFQAFFDNLTRLIEPLIPRYADEGKKYLTIAIGCTGGQHRSVFVVERLNTWLGDKVTRLQLRHRDLDKTDNYD
ncbi:MAG: RNase adapter RapZ [Rhodospirillales bacterium]|nr:RNase adapter RapZ [Rhodospirillales bacterium]